MSMVGTCQHCHGRLEFEPQQVSGAIRCPLCGQSTLLPLADAMAPGPRLDEAAIRSLERPSPSLLTYYVLRSLLAGPFFPVVLLLLYFRYHTLRYRFDAEGILMRWGVLFRREIVLNYARIQDIHLTSNVIERWLGLARVQIQTASGSAAPEMTIEGLHEFDAVRDFLYAKMRGIQRESLHPGLRSRAAAPSAAGLPWDAHQAAELTAVLREVAEELRAIRRALGRDLPGPQTESDDRMV